MPSLADLKKRFSTSSIKRLPDTTARDQILEWEAGEETLVVDNRGALSPTQCVDQKLRDALSGGQLSTGAIRKPR